MGTVKVVAAGLVALAAVAACAGTYLLATVGEEFDPRGRFGLYALLAAGLVGGAAYLVWRRTR